MNNNTYDVPLRDFAGSSFWLPCSRAPPVSTEDTVVQLPTGVLVRVTSSQWTSAEWRERKRKAGRPAARLLLVAEVLRARRDDDDDAMDLAGTADPVERLYLAHEDVWSGAPARQSLPWEEFERLVWSYVQLLAELALVADSPALDARRLTQVHGRTLALEARAVVLRFFLVAVAAEAVADSVKAVVAATPYLRPSDAERDALTRASPPGLVAAWWRIEHQLVALLAAAAPVPMAKVAALTPLERLSLGCRPTLLPKQPSNADVHAHLHERTLREQTILVAEKVRKRPAVSIHDPPDLARFRALGRRVLDALGPTVGAGRPFAFFEHGWNFQPGSGGPPPLSPAILEERARRREEHKARLARGEWAPPRDRMERRERALRVADAVGDLEDLFAPARTLALAPCMAAVLARARQKGHLINAERLAVGRWLTHVAPRAPPSELVALVFPPSAPVHETRRAELRAAFAYHQRKYAEGKSYPTSCAKVIGNNGDGGVLRCPFAEANPGADALACQRACSRQLGFTIYNPLDPLLHYTRV